MKSVNLCQPLYDIINYSTSICLSEFGKYGKEGKKLQKSEYLENEKSFLDEIKNIFHSFWRPIIWWKNKNLIKKIADTSFEERSSSYKEISLNVHNQTPVQKFCAACATCHMKTCLENFLKPQQSGLKWWNLFSFFQWRFFTLWEGKQKIKKSPELDEKFTPYQVT